MDDELELTDPEHPDAHEAAAATARLLVAIHEQHRNQIAEEDVAESEGEPPCPAT